MTTLPADIWKDLKAADIALPDDVARMVIDIKAGEMIKVYYESNASKKVCDVVIESLSRNKEDIDIINVKDKG